MSALDHNYRALLTVVLTLLLGLSMTAATAQPAQAAYVAVSVEDQIFNVRGDQGLSLYLKSNGGDTDGTVVRWTTAGAPSWIDVQPNGYVTGVVPPAGGTFTFTITGTSGTYAGAPVSQDSATATIVAEPVDFDIGFATGDPGAPETTTAVLTRTVYLAVPLKIGLAARTVYHREAVWSAQGLPRVLHSHRRV